MQQTSDVADIKRALLQKYLNTAQKPGISPGKAIQGPRALPLQTGTKTPFFFLHGDWTGNAFFCFNLARSLGSDQPFYILDTYEFGQQRELPTLEKIAAEQLQMIRAVQPEGPYRLGGFCNGALIAYEMAQQLSMSGQTVDLLILMDAIPARHRQIRKAFNLLARLFKRDESWQLEWFLRLQHVLRYTLNRHAEDYVHIKTLDPRIDQLFPPLETLRREFPAMFIWATSEYEPGDYAGKVTLFWDEEEPERRGWWQRMMDRKYSNAEVHIIPGSHESCKIKEGMGEHLKQCLEQVEA